jgi:hypothetical protein
MYPTFNQFEATVTSACTACLLSLHLHASLVQFKASVSTGALRLLNLATVCSWAPAQFLPNRIDISPTDFLPGHMFSIRGN